MILPSAIQHRQNHLEEQQYFNRRQNKAAENLSVITDSITSLISDKLKKNVIRILMPRTT
jgi:hypothetical protein